MSRWMASFMTWTPRRIWTRSSATISMWWWTGSSCGRGSKRGWPTVFARRWTWPAASRCWKWLRPRKVSNRNALPFRKISPARSAASRSRKSNRVCFPSTRPTAPVHNATGWGSSCSSTNAWWCQTRCCGWRTVPSPPGARARHPISCKPSRRWPSTTSSTPRPRGAI